MRRPEWLTRNPVVWVLSIAGLWVLAGYVFGAVMLARHGELRKSLGWQSSTRADGTTITHVDPKGPAAGLNFGTAIGAAPFSA